MSGYFTSIGESCDRINYEKYVLNEVYSGQKIYASNKNNIYD